MNPSAEFRLPGVTFLPHLRVQRPALPALEAAAFVGFAERGPLHLPVAVEDYDAYQRVFGGDLPLAQEPGGRVVNAGLPRAVQAFFANGGRRCYVVRVAGPRASAARLRIPGLVALGGLPGEQLAGVSASSPGGWGAKLRLAARLGVIPLAAGAFSFEDTTGQLPVLLVQPAALDLTGVSPLCPGDVLRLQTSDGGRWLAVISAVEREKTPRAGMPLTGPTPVRLTVRRFFRLVDSLEASPPEAVLSADLLTINGREPLGSDGMLTQDGEGHPMLKLTPEDATRLSTGDVLRLRLAGSLPGDLGFLARIAEIRAMDQGEGTPHEPVFWASFAALLHLGPPDDAPTLQPDASPLANIEVIELLRLDLLLQYGSRPMPMIPGLAFNAPHPIFWGDAVLLESSLANERASGAAGSPTQNSSGTNGRESPYTTSATWFRALVEDLYDMAPMTDPSRTVNLGQGFNPTAALAGLLAPTGSVLGLTWDTAQRMPDDREVAQEQFLTFLPLGMPEVIRKGDPAQFRPPEPSRTGNDDLYTFDPSIFYDRRLAPPGAPGVGGFGETQRTLLQSAFDLYYIRSLRLRGLHSLLSIDEVALLSLPDAQHRPWRLGDSGPSPRPPRPVLPEIEPECPPQAEFSGCSRPPILGSVDPYFGSLTAETPVLLQGRGFTTTAETHVFFGLRPAENVTVLSSTQISANVPLGVQPGPVDATITNENGSAFLPSAYIYMNNATPSRLPITVPPGVNDRIEDEAFLPVQQAMVIFCQARGDVMAVLSLPRAYDMQHCLEWQSALRRRLGLPRLDEGLGFDEPQETADLSFAAVYHPWLLIADPLSPDRTRPIPPDGAVCGMIATRERERQVWVAPANLPLRDLLGLETTFTDDEWAELFARRFNLIRPEASSFRPLSAHTLSGERSLLQISVRRLLILLRKAATISGMDFVFENNHEIFREGVRVMLEEMLRFLFQRGAFAGRTEAESFRVITDESVNPRQSIDQGRFVAVIQVAPSQPMEFITVRLTRTGEGRLTTTET